jgi:serine/threonine-protein kinase
MVSSEAMGLNDRGAERSQVHAGQERTPGSAAQSGDDVPRALGRYVLLKRIARGGMGEVFLASTTGIEGAERPVVVKVIRREHVNDPSFIARFLDEARVQAQLQHSGVAQVLEATLDEKTGEPYAVVEHVEGRSLGDLRARALQIGQALGWAEAVAIGTLIAEALAHVHERLDVSGRALAIVHRDLSPQNVMVSYAGECKIIDFGTARGQNRRCHTVAGVVFAKPGYVAPEVANGDSGDARVDVYALGIMLWELCAGRRFLQGDAAAHMSAVARHAKDPPAIASSIGAPPDLDAIIAKLTAFDREARYGAVRAAASDLARLLTAAPALPAGERGVRARVAALMVQLFPGEPSKGRREFARLVAASRANCEPPRAGRPAPKAVAESEAGAQAPRAPLAKEGDVLGGTRYKLLREIGRGASSVVYEAEHLDLGKRVAIKVIAEGEGRSAEHAPRFRREARTLSRLSHEGLVTVHDVGQAADGRLFCVMELLEGETLEARLLRARPLPWREVLAVGQRVLAALEVAHAASLVHRDIKPANVFLPRPRGDVSEGATIKLLDFGLAHGIGEGESGTPSSTRGGVAIFGTPEYMAPEQATVSAPDARADLYALGCMLYEMLTGRLPFAGASAVAILDAKAKGNPERPRCAAPTLDIPETVDGLVMRALARHPSERFQTASEMRRAIEAVLHAPVRGVRGRLAAAGAMVALVALAAAFGVARTPRLRTALHWPHHQEVVAVAATEAAPSDPAHSNVDAPRDATQDEDGFDVGEDGDFVDDTPPATPTAAPEASSAKEAAPPPPAAAPSVPPATTAEPVAVEKPQRRKHKKGGAKKAAASAQAGDAPASAPANADVPAPKKDKPRRKHKAKVAEVQ